MNYDFGMMGIGVMGSNLLLNIADNGYAVIGYDLKQERAEQLEAAAPEGTKVKGTTDLQLFAASLSKPRKIMMLVPAGAPVDSAIAAILHFLEDGDILIDGGNSYFKHTKQRILDLQSKGIHFFGMGVSGGEAGARFGPSLMPGGDEQAWEHLKPVMESVAAKVGGKPCAAYMGSGAAGHYVKMVHNGIEYAMMQLIAEVYDILRKGAGFDAPALSALFAKWNEGELQSYLIEITADIFRTTDNLAQKRDQYLVDQVLDQAGSKGTGKWTSQEAMDLPVSIPTIDMAVAMRDLSVYREQRLKAAALYKNPVNSIEADPAFLTSLEHTLVFSFLICYTQGLSMLAKASEVHGMNIPLPSVIQVWKGGCIIRSSLLQNFSEAFARNGKLENLLLDGELAKLAASLVPHARKTAAMALGAGLPVAALTSAISYFDAYCSDSLPMNLIQSQRDYFGAHTYRRVDREGVFHTEWNEEGRT